MSSTRVYEHLENLEEVLRELFVEAPLLQKFLPLCLSRPILTQIPGHRQHL